MSNKYDKFSSICPTIPGTIHANLFLHLILIIFKVFGDKYNNFEREKYFGKYSHPSGTINSTLSLISSIPASVKVL